MMPPWIHQLRCIEPKSTFLGGSPNRKTKLCQCNEIPLLKFKNFCNFFGSSKFREYEGELLRTKYNSKHSVIVFGNTFRICMNELLELLNLSEFLKISKHFEKNPGTYELALWVLMAKVSYGSTTGLQFLWTYILILRRHFGMLLGSSFKQ